jgi:Uma2 family endonuclease
MTDEQYLAVERAAETKSEFFDGEMYAMSGATRPHILITGNIFGELYAQLKGGPCEVYNNDMRVSVRDPSSYSYTYPDLVAVCGEPRFRDDTFDTLLNPALIVEVLSPSTEAFDRGGKFARYRRLDSLKEYVLVSQDRALVERFQRRGEQWLLTEYRGLDAELELESIGCAIRLKDIYARIDLPVDPDEGEAKHQQGSTAGGPSAAIGEA